MNCFFIFSIIALSCDVFAVNRRSGSVFVFSRFARSRRRSFKGRITGSVLQQLELKFDPWQFAKYKTKVQFRQIWFLCRKFQVKMNCRLSALQYTQLYFFFGHFDYVLILFETVSFFQPEKRILLSLQNFLILEKNDSDLEWLSVRKVVLQTYFL